MVEVERHSYDVVVIGAGGAGLRAVIEARERGLKVAVVCKSLFGKAHTVMAEGGCAAAMGNASEGQLEDSLRRHDARWKVPEQLAYGRAARQGGAGPGLGVGDLRRAVRPHRRWPNQSAQLRRTHLSATGARRRPHRPGVDPHPAAKVVSLQQEDHAELGDYEARIKVFAECTITELLKDQGAIAGAFGYWRESGRFIVFEAPAVVLATGGIGKSFKVTSNSWEYTGDGHALALRAGATLINMEFVQFHPTGMVWPPSVKGILVTEGVRGDGGVLKNSENSRFMFDYIPPVFKGQYAETEEEADQWLKDNDSARRTPDLLPRDEVARAINSEVKAGRGTPHGGVYLDIASRLTPAEIKRRLPSMYHQFKELAEVDITTQAMEVGPTCHYVMGGVEVDADTGAATVPGLFAAGECAGGMHGSNRLGGNSLSDLLVFGRRAGLGAADYVRALSSRPAVSAEAIDAAAQQALSPFEGPKDGSAPENPYALHMDLQYVMNDLVGIIRNADEISRALTLLAELWSRYHNVLVEGHRQYNPGWNLSIDLRNMLLVSECVARAALQRTESRGGHTRDDHPGMDPNWRRILLVCRATETMGTGGSGSGDSNCHINVTQQLQTPMRPDLLELFEISELEKYYTDEELAEHPGRRG